MENNGVFWKETRMEWDQGAQRGFFGPDNDLFLSEIVGSGVFYYYYSLHS